MLEHCDCKNCARADPKSEDYIDFTKLLNQYLFCETQKNVRKAKLELASTEQSYDNLTKLLDKKNLIFFFLGRRLPRESKSFAFVKYIV